MSFGKYTVLAFFIVLATSSALPTMTWAQQADQTHFFYVQADKNQPFYIVLNHKIYESSSIGYLIISKLKDGEYRFTVGFPKDAYPSQDFYIKIKGNDAGYGLKLINGNSWEMVNLQTREMLSTAASSSPEKPQPVATDNTAKTETTATVIPPAVNKSQAKEQKATASFGEMLGQAVGEEKKAVLPKPVEKTATKVPASIARLDQASNRRGIRTTYTVTDENGIVDTVDTFIPNTFTEETPIAKGETENTALSKDTVTASQSNNPFYAGNAAVVANSVDTANIITADLACGNAISEKDFGKIKNKMLSKSSSEPEMIAAAEKATGNKCLTTEQLQRLGNLLLSDATRLTLYTTMFPHISDQSRFPALESQLIDSSYKSQFRSFLERK